jgi:hypothetical protein
LAVNPERNALLVLAAAWFMSVPGPARADAVADAALDAADVSTTWCANLASRKADEIVRANKAVGDALDKVHAAYQESQDPSLLYWRAQLAQCLDRRDLAVADFEAFVASQEGRTMYGSMVKDANQRLVRLRGKKRGEGPSATWLRRSARMEGELRLQGGASLRTMQCTDWDDGVGGGRSINAACLGTVRPRTLSGGSLAGEGGAALSLYADAREVGKGVRASPGVGGAVSFGLWSPAPYVDGAFAGGPQVDLAVGPRLRWSQAPNAGKQAWSLRLDLDFVTALTPLVPWAGAAKYPETGLLDPGTWLLPAFGGGGVLRLGVELDERTVLELGVDGAIGLAPASAIRQVRQGKPVWIDAGAANVEPEGTGVAGCAPADDVTGLRCESAERLPDVANGLRWRLAGGITILRPRKDGVVALGPSLQVGYRRTDLGFVDDGANDWWVDTDTDANRRRIYSSRSGEWLVRLGIVVRLGSVTK